MMYLYSIYLCTSVCILLCKVYIYMYTYVYTYGSLYAYISTCSVSIHLCKGRTCLVDAGIEELIEASKNQHADEQ